MQECEPLHLEVYGLRKTQVFFGLAFLFGLFSIICLCLWLRCFCLFYLSFRRENIIYIDICIAKRAFAIDRSSVAYLYRFCLDIAVDDRFVTDGNAIPDIQLSLYRAVYHKTFGIDIAKDNGVLTHHCALFTVELTIEDGCDKIGIYADVVELVDSLDLGAVTLVKVL